MQDHNTSVSDLIKFIDEKILSKIQMFLIYPSRPKRPKII